MQLDVKTRLSIRDSLFRLAKSAIRRHNICDISSTNKRSNDEDEVLGSEEASSDYRYLNLTIISILTRKHSHLKSILCLPEFLQVIMFILRGA